MWNKNSLINIIMDNNIIIGSPPVENSKLSCVFFHITSQNGVLLPWGSYFPLSLEIPKTVISPAPSLSLPCAQKPMAWLTAGRSLGDLYLRLNRPWRSRQMACERSWTNWMASTRQTFITKLRICWNLSTKGI